MKIKRRKKHKHQINNKNLFKRKNKKIKQINSRENIEILQSSIQYFIRYKSHSANREGSTSPKKDAKSVQVLSITNFFKLFFSNSHDFLKKKSLPAQKLNLFDSI